MSGKLNDASLLIAAGIDQRTGLPAKFARSAMKKEEIKIALRIIDEQDAVNRYKWDGLPAKLTGQELERMIYYKGQLAFFYMPELQEYYFSPYALDGTIDFYGRYNTVHPVPFASGASEDEKRQLKILANYFAQKRLKCHYTVPENDVIPEESCVLLKDYTMQMSQTIKPRVNINEPILDVMSECIPFLRTSLIAGTGIKGMRVNDADQKEAVDDASASVQNAALNGNVWIPIIGSLEFQELAEGSKVAPEEYMQAMQSLDNFRLSTYGLDNGGLYQKKAHMLQEEEEKNDSQGNIVMQDGLEIRKHFCEVANAIFGTNISVDINDVSASQVDEGMNEEEGEDYGTEDT